jgi:hypothetical protein
MQTAREIDVREAAPDEAAAVDDVRLLEEHVRSELDARQDEVLRLLDDLNARIEAAIREFAPAADRHDDRLAAA